MRAWIGLAVSEALYGLGHLTSKVMHWPGCGRMYFIYNTLMGWSVSVQEWGGGSGPWQGGDK